MILLDTNLLVYAHRERTPEHAAARDALERACGDARGCGIAACSMAEFWSVVTHPKSTGRPSKPSEATGFLSALVEQGGARWWTSSDRFADRLGELATKLQIAGARIFDLQIALTGLDNGATEVWTHDAGFVRARGLRVVDPLG